MSCKVCTVYSFIDKSVHFELVAERLSRQYFEQHIILLNPKYSQLATFLQAIGIPVYQIKYRGKKDIVSAMWQMRSIFSKIRPDVVHAHLFDASLIAMSLAACMGIKKRIYTRHHSNYHHLFFPHAVKYDRWINRQATHIVAVSPGVIKVLHELEGVKLSKIHLIYNCFDIDRFDKVTAEEVRRLQALYNPNNDRPVIGVISRYTKLKGIQFIIPAIRRLRQDFPTLRIILANAHGDYASTIKTMLAESFPPQQYTEIHFEPNLYALYKLFDIFIHVPIGPYVESAGAVYVEALAAGIPAVFTKSGVAHEFIEDQHNAWVVDYENSDQIYLGAHTLLTNRILAQQLATTGAATVKKLFRPEIHLEKLQQLYIE